MLSTRQRNLADLTLLSPNKPKIINRMLPIDFFEHGASLQVRKSQQVKFMGIPRDSATPIFGKKRPSSLKIDKMIVSAIEKRENQNINQEDQTLIRDVIFSSRNIGKLRKLSIGMERSKLQDSCEFSLYTSQLPPIKQKRLWGL